MPTSVKMVACYTSLVGSTILPEVRTISGIALAPLFIEYSYNDVLSWISNATRSFLVRFLGEQKMNKEKNSFKRIFLFEIRLVIFIAIHILYPSVSESQVFHCHDNRFILRIIKRPVK
jgi:hypothetical protein